MPPVSKALSFLAVTLCALGQWIARDVALRHHTTTSVYEHVYYLPPPATLRLFSIGQPEALADLLWARALVYLGEESTRNLTVDHALDYGRVVVALDPYFSRAYRVFALGGTSRPGVTADEETERIRKSLAFLEEGVRMLPDDGQLAWDTGATYAYTYAPRLKDLHEYEEAKRRGVDHMQAAAMRGFGPPWAGVANASTLMRLGQTDRAIAHLQELYAIASDPEVRADIENKLAQLRSEAFMEGLRQVVLQLRRDHQRDFPYVSETMYLLLGHRPPFAPGTLIANHFDPAAGKLDEDPTQTDSPP